MQIGEAAAASGCHIETIRYYDRVGLRPRRARTAGGYRDYLLEEAGCLLFFTCGRALGFSLDEIRGLLWLAYHSALSCHDVNQLARHDVGEHPASGTRVVATSLGNWSAPSPAVLVASAARARFGAPYAAASRGERHITARKRRSVS